MGWADVWAIMTLADVLTLIVICFYPPLYGMLWVIIRQEERDRVWARNNPKDTRYEDASLEDYIAMVHVRGVGREEHDERVWECHL